MQGDFGCQKDGVNGCTVGPHTVPALFRSRSDALMMSKGPLLNVSVGTSGLMVPPIPTSHGPYACHVLSMPIQLVAIAAIEAGV